MHVRDTHMVRACKLSYFNLHFDKDCLVLFKEFQHLLVFTRVEMTYNRCIL